MLWTLIICTGIWSSTCYTKIEYVYTDQVSCTIAKGKIRPQDAPGATFSCVPRPDEKYYIKDFKK